MTLIKKAKFFSSFNFPEPDLQTQSSDANGQEAILKEGESGVSKGKNEGTGVKDNLTSSFQLQQLLERVFY